MEILEKTDNPDLEKDDFYNVANMLLGNPFTFCLYGTNDKGQIQAGIIGHFDILDHCIYLDDSFGHDLQNGDEGLKQTLSEAQQIYGAKKIKRTRAEILD